MSKNIFCSTIIPTIGRATLSRAVNSVLDQEVEGFDFEVIVVNDSGNELPDLEWTSNPRIKILNTKKRERSVARNTGAACANGEYLHFLDDDDWMLPGAMLAFRKVTQEVPHAIWLYGATQLVDRENNPLIQLHHRLNGNCFLQIMSGEWIPLQSSIIPADTFFELKGFLPGLSSTQDVDLCRRAALLGDFAETDVLVSCVGMGEKNSTTNRAKFRDYALWAREQILNMPNTYERMKLSAPDGEWKARITRIYLTSIIWNWRNQKFFTATSRGMFALLSLLAGFPSFFSGKFWRAIAKPYASSTFAKGFNENRQTS